MTPTIQFTSGQTIKGWGVYPGGGPNPFWQNPAAEQAVYALKPTFVRDQIDPALYVSGDKLDNIVLNDALLAQYVAKISKAKASGVKEYILSIWSPPAVMKNPPQLAGGAPLANEPLFIAFVTKVIEALAASSIGLPAALAIQNEPEVVADYASCVYTPAAWLKTLTNMWGSLRYAKVAVPLIGPETGLYSAALPYLAQDTWPLAGYALHTYGECSIAQLNAAIVTGRSGRDVWMTEFSKPNGSTELAWTLDTMAALAAHLVLVPFNYWAWWIGYATSAVPPDNGSLIGGVTTTLVSKRYWALQRLWSLVPPGWVVRPLRSTDPALPAALGAQDPCTARVNVIAFSSPDESETVIMIVNATTSPKVVQCGGVPGTSQASWVTDATRDMVPQPQSNVFKGFTTIQCAPESVTIAQLT